MTKINIEMKKILPRISRNPQGFTLIELMVVITIIAVLSLISVVAFNTVQKNARDAKRRGDIDAIANALEANKDPIGNYKALAAAQFAAQSLPTPPAGSVYCANLSTTTTTPPTKPVAGSGASEWASHTTCATGWTALDAAPAPDFTGALSWGVCAHLESAPTDIYCRFSAQ